jgi:hypothetical protein
MSHERTGEMMTLQEKHKIPFTKFQYYRAEDGVAQWRHLSKPDKTKPHPFREDTELDDGTWTLGQPSLYFIVDDDQLVLAKDDHGMKLLDDQVSTWDYVAVKVTENGQTQQKPSKVNDDFCDALKSTLALFGPGVTRKTAEERREDTVAPKFRIGTLQRQVKKQEITPEEYSQALLTRQVQLAMPKVINGNGKPKGRFGRFKR